jgi:hypothetical protein
LEGAPEIYLVLSDSSLGFLSVKDLKGDFEKDVDVHGNTIWTSKVFGDISDFGSYDITAVIKPRDS